MKTTLIAIGLFVTACHPGSSEKASAAAASANVAPPTHTDLIPLGEKALVSSLRVPGELISYERVDLYAKVSSFVKKIHVDVGSEVKMGELLATLEAPEVLSQLAAADADLAAQQSAYDAAKNTYERMVQTAKTPGTISANDLDQQSAKVNGELARLNAQKSSRQALASIRSYLEMRAPFPGVVSARNVSPGAYVGPAGRGSENPLFTLQQQSRLRLVVSVPEANVGHLEPGAEVEFAVKAQPGRSYVAKVARLAGALDTRLRAERIEMDVDNADRSLVPGMVAEVVLPMSAKQASFVVPKSAVIRSTLGTFVVRAKEDHAEWVTVQVGREVEEDVEIFGKLAKGELLVKRATEELRDGAPLGMTQKAAP